MDYTLWWKYQPICATCLNKIVNCLFFTTFCSNYLKKNPSPHIEKNERFTEY